MTREEREKPAIIVKEEVSIAEKIKNLKAMKRYEEIINLYEKNEKDVNDITSLNYVMEAYYLNKKYDEVIAIGEKFLNLYPNYSDGRLNLMLGVSYYHKAQYEAARRNLIKAKELGVRSNVLTLYLIDMYMKKGQNSLALIESSNLDDKNKFYIQGLIYYSERNCDKAIENFNQVITYRDSIVYKVFCLYQLKKEEEILKLWEGGFLQEYDEPKYIVSNIYFKKGEINRAMEILKDLSSKNSPMAEKNLKFLKENFIFEKD